MTWATDLQAGIEGIYSAFSVAATHIDRDGTSTAVRAIVVRDLQQFGDVADVSGKTAAISVRVSELALSPRRGDRFTVGSTTYTVDSAIAADELEWTVLCA